MIWNWKSSSESISAHPVNYVVEDSGSWTNANNVFGLVLFSFEAIVGQAELEEVPEATIAVKSEAWQLSTYRSREAFLELNLDEIIFDCKSIAVVRN